MVDWQPIETADDYRLGPRWATSGSRKLWRAQGKLRESSVTSCMPESFLICQSFIDTVAPPRDPNDEDEAEDEDDRDVEEDDQPAVIREPDEDE